MAVEPIFESYGNKLIGVPNNEESSGSGGHVIENSSGTDLPQEDTLQFADSHVTDDSTNSKTVVETFKALTSQEYVQATEDGAYIITDGDGAVIEPASEDYVEVTADGVKTYATLLNELFALIDLSKVDENTTLQFLSGISSVQAVNANSIYLTQSVFVGGNMEMTTVFLKSGASTYKYVRYNGSTFTPTDASNNTPTNGTKITLYYGNKKAIVDLQTTANRCWMSDGVTSVERAITDLVITTPVVLNFDTTGIAEIPLNDGYVPISLVSDYANSFDWYVTIYRQSTTGKFYAIANRTGNPSERIISNTLNCALTQILGD